MSSGDRGEPAGTIPDGLYERTQALVAAATINRSYDVKSLANRSRDGKIVYIDCDVPVILPKCGIDTGKTLPWHELSEWIEQNEGKPYDENDHSAHPIATAVEKKRVEELGGDWTEYTREMDGLIEAVDKKIIANPPPDQDERVFESKMRSATMPTPNKDEKQEDFIHRCVPIVLKDGTAKDQDQAVAVCGSIWREHQKKAEARSWYSIKAEANAAPEIMVYDEIGGWGVTAAAFDKSLKALGDVKEITMRVNSPGGDVFQGLAIHNALTRHPATITAHVDGIAASAAALITAAADKIVMPENSFMVVHNPVGMTYGDDEAHLKMAADLASVKDSIAQTHATRSKQPLADVRALMAEDRLMSAQECKDKGYCDEMIPMSPFSATFSLDKLPEKHRPVLKSLYMAEQTVKVEIDAKAALEEIAKEAERVTEIHELGASAKLDATFIEAAIASGTSKKEFRKAVLAKLIEEKSAAQATEAGAAAVVVPPPAAAAVAEPTAAAEYGQAEIDETMELCTLAKADVATAGLFIKAKTPIVKVREALLAARARKSDAAGIIAGDTTADIDNEAALVVKGIDPRMPDPAIVTNWQKVHEKARAQRAGLNR